MDTALCSRVNWFLAAASKRGAVGGRLGSALETGEWGYEPPRTSVPAPRERCPGGRPARRRWPAARWKRLDDEAAVERAYVIGVGERLGDDDRDELERIHASRKMDHARSLVELAHEEGRSAALDAAPVYDSHAALWNDLVDDPVTVDPEAVRSGDRDWLPEALSVAEMLDTAGPEGTERLDLPGLLDR
jgi:hypothetical protein